MANFQTYQAVGNREDLIDLITNISPVDTPILSMTKTVRATNTLHEWQTDALKSPEEKAKIEGADADYKTITPTVRLNNYTQIIENAFRVTDTQETVDSAGRSSEIEYQTQKAMKEIANDIEYALVVNSAAASGASATARKAKGINGWVTTNVSSATAARDLTSALVDALSETVWLKGGKPDVILTGGAQKRKFTNTTNFPGITKNVQASVGEYKNFVDIYQGGIGGAMKIIPSTIMGVTLNTKIFLLEMAKWRKAFLRPVKREEMARVGSARRFMIEAEVTLEALEEKASGVITNLST